jgi:hypothetical protein
MNILHEIPKNAGVSTDHPLMVEALPPLPHLQIETSTIPEGKVPVDRFAREFVHDSIKVMCMLYQLYGFKTTEYATAPTANHWLRLATHVPVVALFKYKLAAFYSAWKGQKLPPSPFPSHFDNPRVLLGGRAYRWLHLLSEDEASKSEFESFITSVLYSKKGMPRPNNEMLKQAEIDTVAVLTNEPALPVTSLLPWGEVKEFLPVNIELSKRTLCDEVRRTVKEIFHGKQMLTRDWMKPFFPSTSANYIASRSNGGAVPFVVKVIQDLGLTTKENLIHVVNTGTPNCSSNVLVDDTPLRSRWEQVMGEMRRKALTEEPHAVPLALPEALKVRVITKGPPYLNTFLKPVQKFLWSTLKTLPAFSLIGETVSVEYIQSRMGKTLPEGKAFLSVDYKDATNQLRGWLSDTATDAISDELGFDSELRLLFKRSLTGHYLVDPTDYANGDVDKARIQKNGQLMGSITSFPILCIINAAICRWSLEVGDQRVWSLRDAPFCVNGDDGLLKANQKTVDVWERIASAAGLAPSVGKVYYSREFLNINSTTYNFSQDLPFSYSEVQRVGQEPALRAWYFEKVSYVNMGLLLGLKRSGGKVSLDEVGMEQGSLGARARDLVSSSPLALREKVLQSFIHHHSDVLREVRAPWFLPENLGGLGLPSAGRFTADNRTLRLARAMLERGKKPPQKPTVKDWNTWERVLERFPESPTAHANLQTLYEHNAGVEVLSLQTIQGLAAVETLFRVVDHFHPAPDADPRWIPMSYQGGIKSNGKSYSTPLHGKASDLMYSKEAEVKALEQRNLYARHLSDFWKGLRRLKTYPPPLQPSEFPKTLSLKKEHTMTAVPDSSLLEATRLGNGLQLDEEQPVLLTIQPSKRVYRKYIFDLTSQRYLLL